MKTMIGESDAPHAANIQLDYAFRDEDQLKADDIARAGFIYMNSLNEAEKGKITIEEVKTITVVTIGRKILQLMEYPELYHEADLMQQGVEGIATQLGLQDVAVRSRAGIQVTEIPTE